MSTNDSQVRKRVALLDTTVQVDRVKMGSRARHIETLLSSFPVNVATSICLLEFKATIIQECITIHDNLRLRKRFTVVRDSLLEKDYRQSRLRSHIFNNLLNVYSSSFEMDDRDDERLATKARLKLEQVIPRLYDWFVRDSVDAVLRESIQCNRASERPEKGRRVSFRPNLPRCVRGKNKTCSVEAFIRKHMDSVLPALRHVVRTTGEEHVPQLVSTSSLFKQLVEDDAMELSHGDCRKAGDCLIVLEGMNHASHGLSANAREWSHLCRIIGLEFLHVKYTDETTR